MPIQLNPYGHKQSAGMGMDVCPGCGGAGEKYIHESQLPKDRRIDTPPTDDRRTHPSADSGDFNPFVWFYGPVGAIYWGGTTPWDLWWPIAAFLGFLVFGFCASLISEFRLGRYVLAGIAALLIVLVVIAIWTGDSGGS